MKCNKRKNDDRNAIGSHGDVNDYLSRRALSKLEEDVPKHGHHSYF